MLLAFGGGRLLHGLTRPAPSDEELSRSNAQSVLAESNITITERSRCGREIELPTHTFNGTQQECAKRKLSRALLTGPSMLKG